MINLYVKLIPFSVFTLQLATVLGPTSYQLYNFGNATSEHCLQQTTVSIEQCVPADTIAWCTTMPTTGFGSRYTFYGDAES